MTASKGVVKHPRVSQRMLEYLRQNPDITIPYPELERVLNVPGATVSNAVNTLIRAGMEIDRPMRGVVIYHSDKQPPKTRTSDVFEYVGSSKGFPIVRGEDHEMYVLFPLHEYLKEH